MNKFQTVSRKRRPTDVLLTLAVGDYVRLHLPDDAIEVTIDEIETWWEQERGGRGHRFHFYPVGPDATERVADAYVLTIEPSLQGGHELSPLSAKVFDEETLEYRSVKKGPVTAVKVLDSGL